MESDVRCELVGPYRLHCVWPEVSAEMRGRVINFWTGNDALTPALAEQRANELLVVADTADGEIAAVSTTVPQYVPKLSLNCFYYRTYVAPQHRQFFVLSLHVLRVSHRWLNQRFKEGKDPEVLGLYLEIENETLRRHHRRTVWTADGLNAVHIGQSESGYLQRVWYFDNSEIP